MSENEPLDLNDDDDVDEALDLLDEQDVEEAEAEEEDDLGDLDLGDLTDEEQEAVASVEVTERVMGILTKVLAGHHAAASAYQEWLDVATNAATLLSFEDTINIMQVTREGEDVGSWVDGDLLVGMMLDGKEASVSALIEKVATATGRTVADLRQKHDCAKYWPPSIRRAFLAKDGSELLTWSHFDRARRGMEFEDACDLIENSVSQSWTVRQMELERMNRRGAASGMAKTAVVRKVEFAINALRSLSKETLPPSLAADIHKLIERLETHRVAS